MGIKRDEMIISKEVAASSEECTMFTPAVGEFSVVLFQGEGTYNEDSVIKLVWDYNGGSEEILWSTHGAGVMPLVITRTGDNSKKLCICLDNGSASSVVMSGYCKVEQEV